MTEKEEQQLRQRLRVLEENVVGLHSAKKLLEDAAKRHQAKWQDYEKEHILPMFAMAKEIGVPLQRLVLDNPGKTSTVLFASYLQSRRNVLKDFLREQLKAAESASDPEEISEWWVRFIEVTKGLIGDAKDG